MYCMFTNLVTGRYYNINISNKLVLLLIKHNNTYNSPSHYQSLLYIYAIIFYRIYPHNTRDLVSCKVQDRQLKKLKFSKTRIPLLNNWAWKRLHKTYSKARKKEVPKDSLPSSKW